MDWTWLPAAAKDGAPWLIVAVLVVGFWTALRTGAVWTDRSVKVVVEAYQGRLQDARETIADQRQLLRDQVDIDRKRQEVLEDLLEGQRATTALLEALPVRPRPAPGGRR